MRVGRTSGETFVHGFRERVAAAGRPGQDVVDEPGIVALVGSSPDSLDGRVLVTDDRATETLRELLPVLNARVINVFAGAVECSRLVATTGSYRAESCTAMVCDHLDGVPAPRLPGGLTLRDVAQSPGDIDGVALVDAAASAFRSDPKLAPTTDFDAFVEYLRMAPNARFLAAVDERGAVHATSAASLFGTTAGVFFVNTDPGWRGRGVGTAMTAAALRVAAAAGARAACLDSSRLGLSIYHRLGFDVVSASTQFVRED